MTTTLRHFLANREAEIRDQLKALKAELKEINVAKEALEPKGAGGMDIVPAATTIKDMARDVLGDAREGYTAQEILEAIKAKHGRDVDRTSLSPQLSRLKESVEVVLQGQTWFLKPLHDAWQERQRQKAMSMFVDDADATQRPRDDYEDYEE